MRRERIERGVVVFFVVLVGALISISVVYAAEELNGTFKGDKIILSHINITEGHKYWINISGGFVGNYSLNSNSNGSLELINNNLTNATTIKVTLEEEFNDSKNFLGDLIELTNENPSRPPNPASTTTQTTSTETQKESKTEGEMGGSIFSNITSNITSNIFFYIFLVILGLVSAGWVLYEIGFIGSKHDEEPRRLSQVPEQVVQTTYKLKVDLNDGTAKIPDRTVKITDKSNYPISERKSDLNGSCTFELPKQTYIINVKGGENYEDHSKEIRLSNDKTFTITLVKRQILQIEVVDESGKPIKGIFVKVKESRSGVEAPGNPETDINGIAKFTLSRNKQYTASVIALMMDYVIPENMEIIPSDTTKRIILKKKEGMLEITVTEQGGKLFAGIPVTVVRKGTNQVMEFISDNNGKINRKVLIGDYTVNIKPAASQLYDTSEKQVTVLENKRVSVVLALHFNYQPKNETITAVNKHYDKLNNSFIEVSAYDRCIPLFLKSVGETPLKLIERIIKRPVEFLDSKTTPDEIINHILSAEEIISEEISRIMREKSNVDFYFSIKNLPQVEDLVVSDYSQEKFNELIHDTSNYHKNHFREIGNKLHDIDTELTDLSRSLTIQPVADLWRVAQKLQDNCNNESDVKKKGVMLFINDKLLDHIKEMYTREELRERLKFSLL